MMTMTIFKVIISILLCSLKSCRSISWNHPIFKQNHHFSSLTSSSSSNFILDYSNPITRDIEFWKRSIEIFSSYKKFQFQLYLHKLGRRRRGILFKRDKKNHENDENQNSFDWDEIHELNSSRMINLCMDLRGFYLKAGQFLGTRYDFMPTQYTSKLSKLHDDVTPIEEKKVTEIIEQELKSPWKKYFTSINFKKPLGSASIAQVHLGYWKQTNEKVAIKVQYPNAEKLMKRDLNNLRILAEFLQHTELKFDLLTCIKELQRRIVNEFDFIQEANNLYYMRNYLMPNLNNIIIPKPIYFTRKLLVMSFIDGENLGKLAEFRDKPGFQIIPKWIKQKFGKKLLDVLANAWGYQIFILKKFNADPHPGNICIHTSTGEIGLLDWGQVVTVPDLILQKFAFMNRALCTRDKDKVTKALIDLGIILKNPLDTSSACDIGTTLLDTRNVEGYVINPFQPGNALKKNSVLQFPPDLYFIIRSVQLMRGISFGFGLDYSLAEKWSSYAEKYLQTQNIIQTGKKNIILNQIINSSSLHNISN